MILRKTLTPSKLKSDMESRLTVLYPATVQSVCHSNSTCMKYVSMEKIIISGKHSISSFSALTSIVLSCCVQVTVAEGGRMGITTIATTQSDSHSSPRCLLNILININSYKTDFIILSWTAADSDFVDSFMLTLLQFFLPLGKYCSVRNAWDLWLEIRSGRMTLIVFPARLLIVMVYTTWWECSKYFLLIWLWETKLKIWWIL